MKRNKTKSTLVYEKIKNSIENRKYKENEKIPSIREIARREGVSKNTVIQAIEELLSEGYIRAKSKSGYFVERIDNLYQGNPGTKFHKRMFTDSRKFRINLSHSAIDADLFPIRNIQGIYRSILDEKREELMLHSEPQGMISLRESISDYLFQYKGIKAKAENIVISSGMEYLYQIIIHLIDKNSVLGLEGIGYDVMPALLEMNNLAYIDVPVDEKGIDVGFLEKTNISLQVVTPVHQFPTGYAMAQERKNQILDWANRLEKNYIIEDDYDGDLMYLNKENLALKSMDKKDKVIYMSSFSSTISPGTRTSFMVLPDKLLEKYKEKLPFLICPVSNVSQEFLRVFLDEGLYFRHMNKSINHYTKKRERVIEILKKKGDVSRVFGEAIGLYVLVELDTDKKEKDIIKTLQENGILIYGMNKYDRQNMYTRPVLILGFGAVKYDTIEEVIDKIFEIMNL